MMKFDLDDVKSAMLAAGVPADAVAQVTTTLSSQARADAAAAAEERARDPKAQWEHVVFVSADQLAADSTAMGWVVKITPELGYHDLVDRLCQAGQDFNRTRRGKRQGVATLAEVFESVPNTISRTRYGIKIQTKEPVYCIAVKGNTGVDTRSFSLPVDDLGPVNTDNSGLD